MERPPMGMGGRVQEDRSMIRVFPNMTKWTPTDDLAFVGYPPLFLPPEQPVRISVVFTWDLPLAQRLKTAWQAHYKDVQIGGPAVGDPGGDFVPGRFIKDGVTITSRGCCGSRKKARCSLVVWIPGF